MNIPCLVGINGLSVLCVIGVHPWERETQQELIVDCRVEMDAVRCVQTDAVEDVADYSKMAETITAVACDGKFQLVETLAWHILDGLMVHYPITWAAVRIAKPAALAGKGIAVVEMEKGKRLCHHYGPW